MHTKFIKWSTVTSTLLLLLLSQACSSTQVITADSRPAVQSAEQIPDELLLDIGIQPLNPNIPAENSNKLIVADVRKAESRYIAYHLKDTLELTGNWGAVRVIPQDSDAVDIHVTGKILDSNGEQLKVKILAKDSTGKVWLNKEYKDTASKYSYASTQEDPFQDLYNNIADDLLLSRQKSNNDYITKVRQVSAIKYARDLSPDAFSSYIKEQRGGKVKINQLPADDDPMLARVTKIKEQEYLFVDTLDDYYGKFTRDMKDSYDEWRSATYEEAVRLKEVQKQSRNRLVAGALLVAGGIYAGKDSKSWAESTAATTAVIGGVGAIKSGLDRRKEAEIHAESLRELSQSLGSEITPYVMDIEGKTIELSGNATAQYTQWRGMLKEIYAEETGLPVQ